MPTNQIVYRDNEQIIKTQKLLKLTQEETKHLNRLKTNRKLN